MSTTPVKEANHEERPKEDFWTRHKRRMEEMGLANKVSVSLEQGLVETFQAMTPKGKRYQELIEHALQEWLAAQGVKELLREELAELVQQALSPRESG